MDLNFYDGIGVGVITALFMQWAYETRDYMIRLSMKKIKEDKRYQPAKELASAEEVVTVSDISKSEVKKYKVDVVYYSKFTTEYDIHATNKQEASDIALFKLKESRRDYAEMIDITTIVRKI